MTKLVFTAALFVPVAAFAAPPIQQGPLQAPPAPQAPMQEPPKQAPLQAPAKQAPLQAPMAHARMQAPAKHAPVQAPAHMATAPQDGGYRSFSYEPGLQPAAPMSYNTEFYDTRFDGRYDTYRRGYRSGPARHGAYDAGFKVRGDW